MIKVDITLTVGGNDVTIDYAEGRQLFDELRNLYEPQLQPAGYMDQSNGKASCDTGESAGTGCPEVDYGPACDKETTESKVADSVLETLSDLSEPTFISDDEVLPYVGDDAPVQKDEVEERMKAMQTIIDKMNQETK